VPKPPDHGDLFELKFITNVLMAGCAPPFDVIVEFSEEPGIELFMLLAGFDMFDILQGMFEPVKGRRRKPARHGRKRGRIRGLPDANDEIGRRLTPRELKEAFNRLPGARVAFRFINFTEFIGMGAAILEKSGDIAFNPFWGMFENDDLICYDLPRLSRTRDSFFIIGGLGPNPWPINIAPIDFNHGFFDSPFHTNCGVNCGVGLRATLWNNDLTSPRQGSLILGEPTTGTVWAESSWRTIGPGETISIDVSATVPAGHEVHWMYRNEGGAIQATDVNVLVFGEAGWMDWVPDIL